MGLTEGQLAEDLTRAMKARDMPRVYVLRGLLTAAKNLKVERRGGELTEADLVQLARRRRSSRPAAGAASWWPRTGASAPSSRRMRPRRSMPPRSSA